MSGLSLKLGLGLAASKKAVATSGGGSSVSLDFSQATNSQYIALLEDI